MAREIDLGSIVGPTGPAGANGADGSKIIVSEKDLKTGAAAPEGAKEGDIILDSNWDVYQVNAENKLDLKGNIKGESGAGATTAEDVSYGDSTVKKALDDLLYQAIAVTSFTNNVNKAEEGSTVNTVVLSWATNKTPTALTLDGADIDVALKTKTIENANLKKNKRYTLRATDERGAASEKSTEIWFTNGVYYGVGNANGDAINKEFIAGLTKELSSSRGRTINLNAAEGQYIFYAIPARMGTPGFKVGGFDGGFSKVKTFDYENPSGYTESYDVWRSDNAGLGDTTVVIS